MREFGINGIPEMPEHICVETRFIDRELAKLQNLTYLDLGSNGNSQQTIEMSTSNQITPTNTPLTDFKPMSDVGIMTDSPNPLRDRNLQTETETNTIAIQCDLSQEQSDIEFNKYFEESESVRSTDEDFQAEKERFRNFINSKTNSYSNGMLECLLCGEIKRDDQSMESHMALHWGPQKLCFRCGLYFEHKMLWKKHNCLRKRTSNLKYIKCPHYLCSASVISPLELYDHLNEHCDLPLHRCTACWKSFPTTGELRLHFKIKRKCRKTAQKVKPSEVYKIPAEDTQYRNRVSIFQKPNGRRLLVKSYLSQLALKRKINRSYYCNICLRRCKSFTHYQFHTKRCLELYRRRLKRKRISEAVNMMIIHGTNNGHK